MRTPFGGKRSPEDTPSLAVGTPPPPPPPGATPGAPPPPPSAQVDSLFPPLAHSLTSDMAKSVRFNVSEPRGYFFPQVEEYAAQAAASLEHLENAVYQRDRKIHELQVELDLQTYDVQRLRTEMEVFRVQGNPLVNPDGSYVTESQQASEAQANLAQVNPEHLTALEADLAQAQQALAATQADLEQAYQRAQEQDLELQGMRQWAEQVTADVTAAHTAILQRDEALTEAYAEITELRQAVLDLQGQGAVGAGPTPSHVVSAADVEPERASYEVAQPVEDLVDQGSDAVDGWQDSEPVAVVSVPEQQTQDDHYGQDEQAYEQAAATPPPPPGYEQAYEQAAATPPPPPGYEQAYGEPQGYEQVQAETRVGYDTAGYGEPQGYDAVDGASYLGVLDDEGDQPLAVMPVDSELPPGVLLPAGTGAAATYQYTDAAPGVPLNSGEVPLGYWAPELNPEVLAAAQATDEPHDPDGVPQPRLRRRA